MESVEIESLVSLNLMEKIQRDLEVCESNIFVAVYFAPSTV